MSADKLRKVTFYAVGLLLLLSAGLTLYTQANKGLWKAEVRRLNERLAQWEARNDFLSDRIRLLRLEGENSELRFSGEREGAFEIWIPEHYPSVSEASRFSDEQYVELYNLFMKTLQRRNRKSASTKAEEQRVSEANPTRSVQSTRP